MNKDIVFATQFFAKTKMEKVVKSGLGNNKIEVNELFTSETDLFSAPSIDTTYVDSRIIIHEPVNALTDRGPLKFNIPIQGEDDYIDPSNINFYFVLQVVKADGKACVADTDIVAPVNGIGNAMWKHITVDMKGQTLPELNTMYSNYKSHIEMSTMFGTDAINTHLQPKFYFKDEKFDHFTKDSATISTTSKNPAFYTRYQLTKGSKEFEVIDRPACDFCSITKLIPPGIPLVFHFNRLDNDTACLNGVGTTQYTIKIVKAELHVKYLKLHPDIHNSLMRNWAGKKMYLPMTKTSIITKTFAGSIRNFLWTQAFSGILPKQILLGFLPSTTWAGSLDSHCFNFNHTNIQNFCVRKNGVQIPAAMYQVDFTNRKYGRLYADFCKNIGIQGDFGNEITMEAYAANYCFLTINFNEDCNSFHMHKDEQGTIDIQIDTSAVTSAPYILLAVGYSDGLLTIDQWRNVSTTFAINQ